MVPDHQVDRYDPNQNETSSEEPQTHSGSEPHQEKVPHRTESNLAWYRTLYESIPSIYLTLNSTGIVLSINPLGAARLGYTAQELCEKPVFHLFHLEDQAKLQEAFTAYLHSPTPDRNWELCACCKDGSIVWVKANAHTVPGADTDLINLVCEDISEQRQIEAALRKSEEKFRSLVEQTNDWIWEIDRNGVFTYVSPQVYEIVGYEPAEILGKTTFDLMAIDEIKRFAAVLECFISLQKPFARLEKTLTHKDGHLVVLETSGSPVFDSRSGFQGYRGIARDITKRKQAEAALQKAKDELEIRVAERTAELRSANEQLQSEIIERQQTEVALRESEARYRDIFEKDITANSITTPDGHLTACNSAFLRLFGFRSKEEALGCHMEKLHPSKTEREALIDRIRQECMLDTHELHMCRVDGTPITVVTNTIGIFNETGELVEIHNHAFDISERKQAEEALHDAHQRLMYHVENSPLAVIEFDHKLRVLRWSSQTEKVFGWRAEEVLGKSLLNWFVFTEDKERVRCDMVEPLMSGREQRKVIHNRNYTKDGSVIDCEWYNSVLRDEAGKLVSILSFALDVTERQQTEAALRESEERYALAVQGANDGIWDWNLQTNEVYFSTRWKSMLGYEEHEVGNGLDECYNRMCPEDIQQIRAAMAAHIEGLTSHYESEHRMRHKDGTYRWTLNRGLAIRDANGKPYRMAGSQTDITDRKVAEEQLVYDAFHDALTGLSNRALFMDRLGQTIERAKRHEDHLFAVLFLDLDHFKVINDSLGHNIGDQLLIAFTRRLKACTRSEDTVARLGGDEFVILLENITDIGGVIHVAERVQAELVLPFNLSGHEVFTTTSIGIALSTTSYDQTQDLLRDADIALYRAKSLGRARYAMFDPAMHAQALTRLQTENDLRRAIEREEFQVYYQPIVELETSKLRGFEALVRWQHPHQGLVSPGVFIPVAEETGLIVPIGYWVLRQACSQLYLWQEHFSADPPLTISVNLSSKQFSQPDLVQQIDQILQETNLDAHNLSLEITESMIMENDDATATLLQLRDLSVELAIDDFGTGYSSLGRLQHFPINLLKIDRSFVSEMDANQGNLKIIEAIVTLAHQLEMDVIAEGVETAEQLAQLRKLNCHYGQGYLFSRPVDSEAAEALITAQM